jgi:diguanylate cyclase
MSAIQLKALPDDTQARIVRCTLLHQQGQHAELLQGAHAQAVQRGLASHAWRIAASMGAWLLASGRPADALVAMHKLLAQVGDTGPRQTVVRANHAAYQALRQLGRFDEALWHFEVVERLERERTIQQMQAQSVLFVTRAEAQRAQWQAEHAQQDARTQRERAAAFAQSAERDPLTGLGNRRHLDRRCAELLATAQMSQQPLTMVLLDIDHFKAVNDTHGHAVGDAVLLQLAQLLRDNTRAADVLARYGGEEFVMVLPGMGLQRATEVCERLRQRLAAIDWAVWGVHGRGVTVSMGLAAVPAYDAALLLQRADEALYRAKRGGRNRLEWAPATA